METQEEFDRRLKADGWRMRVRSGSIDSRDPLVAFLYTLSRDYVTPGVVEEIMLRHVEIPDVEENQYTNGWLASWAADVASRLRKS